MREFGIDLVIDKTFNVFAETVEEAKELAVNECGTLFKADEVFDIEVERAY